MLRKKFFVDALELSFNPLHLLARGGALLVIQPQSLRSGEPPMRTVHNRGDRLQIANQSGGLPDRGFLLPLCFEKQRGIVQNALANGDRSPAPGSIQLAGFTCVAAVLVENRRHTLAVFETLPRCRDQKLHGHLRRNLALAHLLLNRFRQQLHQCQAP